jgi:hypothetical protein
VASEKVIWGDLQDLVIELRGIEATCSIARHMFTFICLGWSLDESLGSLG